MTVELSRQNATLANLNVRTELHGEDRVPAADLKLEFGLTADDLALFSPTLRASWYDKQSKLLAPEVDGPFDVHGKVVGATVIVHFGVGGKSDIVLGVCEVDQYKLQPADGGSVLFYCRVKCMPDKKQIGELYELQQLQIEVSIEPAQAELPLAGKDSTSAARATH